MRAHRVLARPSLSLAIFAAVALAASAASPCHADWLVTRDGASIEIDGPWKVDGKLVTFSLPGGSYSSVRLSEVDLDASKALTEKALAKTTEKAQPQEMPKATFVLTDEDVYNPPQSSEPLIIDPDDEAQTAVSAPPIPEKVDLVVADWQEQLDVQTTTLEIAGQLRNPGSNPATNISLVVVLYDSDGETLSERSAQIDQKVLSPGGRTRFVASFPDVMNFDRVEFEVRSRGFVNHPGSGEGGIYRGDG